MTWIRVEDELPPFEGIYMGSSIDPENKYVTSQYLSKYDGYGFINNGNYMPVKYWKEISKKFGKVKKDE